MKRLISIGLLLSLITFGLPTKSYAATDGCPDTWVIDTNKFPNEELYKAVLKYGPEVIVSGNKPEKLTSYAGVDGVSPKLANLESLISRPEVLSIGFVGFDSRWRSFLYLYGKSTMQFTIKVEKKGCATPGLFTFNTNVPTGGQGNTSISTPLEVKKVSASQWAEDNPSWFTDFKAQAEFANDLKKATVAVQDFLNNQISLTKDQYVYPHVLFDTYFPSFKGATAHRTLIAQVLDPNCLEFVYSKEYKVYEPSMKLGTKCEFVWSINNYNLVDNRNTRGNTTGDAFNKLIIFDEIQTINVIRKSNSITCIKGKTTKKVSGTNPKCPKGYKVKL